MTKTSAPVRAHRPQPYTVFGAAIVAGAAAAFGLNSALDTHLAQAKPQVESESILVALRALPAGAPVTVWDVGLRDWPKAMVPSSAMRVTDDLDNLIVRHPLREGQPILAVQLGRADAAAVESVARPLAVASPTSPPSREPELDLWEATPTASAAPVTTTPAITAPPTAPVATVTTVSTTFAAGTTTGTSTAPPPALVSTTPTTSTTSTTSTTPTTPTTPTANPVPPDASVTASVPRPEPVAPTAAEVSAPIATTAPTAQPQPMQDPRAPEADAPTARIALAIAPPASQATVEATPPVADADGTSSLMLRNPLRARSSVLQALAVPSRSALTDEIATRSEDSSAGLSSRVTAATAATAVTERSVTVRDTAAEAPRMLPSGSDTTVAPATTTAQAPRARQPRPATTRATATAPATRSARAQSFNKGYRPN